MNYKKIFAKKKEYEDKVKKLLPDIENICGIYIFTRQDEHDIRYAYVGQAKKLISRLAEHLMSYKQHIDLSLKKHGFVDKGNAYGWVIQIFYCNKEYLDTNEQAYIKSYINKGYQMYNKTTGSQGKDKSGIGENKLGKGYYDGIKQGYKNCLNDIRVLFQKYLDPVIKDKPNKVKERKLTEFKELLDEREDNAV